MKDRIAVHTDRVKRGARGGIALCVGVALGVALTWGLGALAQQPYGADSTNLRESVEAGAAPRVAIDSNGRARFSRPLEVPPLYAFDAPLGDTGRQIILVDSETRRICVYWIRQGEAYSTIELVATRAFDLDLKLVNFNGQGLTPSQIREQLESGQSSAP